jgi:NAD-dependent DNA ligase
MNTKSSIEINAPTECPSCNSKLEQVNDLLYCRNTACPAQTKGKIEHFAKVLGIKGLGPKSVEKLQLQEITELFYLDQKEVASVLGDKIATKLLDEIERAKVSTLATVLESFSIPLVGGTASKKIAGVVSSIEEINQETCKQAGLGEKVTQNLLSWKDTEYLELKEFLPFTFSKQTVSDTNSKTVCITGKLKSYKKKADAVESLAAAGYTLVDSVTKSLDYLVDEENKMSTKREKAMQYGITIITDLNDLLKEKT